MIRIMEVDNEPATRLLTMVYVIFARMGIRFRSLRIIEFVYSHHIAVLSTVESIVYRLALYYSF